MSDPAAGPASPAKSAGPRKPRAREYTLSWFLMAAGAMISVGGIIIQVITAEIPDELFDVNRIIAGYNVSAALVAAGLVIMTMALPAAQLTVIMRKLGIRDYKV